MADLACPRPWPVVFRVGHTGLGVGAGCGVGVGVGAPLDLGGVPVLSSAAAGVGSGVSQLRSRFRGVERHLARLLPPGLRAGAGCGVGVGYGFGAGFFLSAGALDALQRRVRAAREAVADRLPASPPALAGAGAQRAGAAEGARLAEQLAQASDSLAALRAEQRALRAALCAVPPPWAVNFCERAGV